MLNAELKEALTAASPGRVRLNEPMRLHTTFRLGGPAEVWAEPQDEQELQRLIGIAAEAQVPVTVVGGGANLLVRDEGIPGLVIHLGSAGFQASRREGNRLLAGAGVRLEWLIRRSQEEGLSGLEFLAGVPGRVGGAARMNAGTHDGEGRLHQFSDVVRRIGVMDRFGQRLDLAPAEAGYSYRASRLNGSIVLDAELELIPAERGRIGEKVRQLWDFKKRTQDWSAPSVGCIFKNPPPGTGDSTLHPSPFTLHPCSPLTPSAGWLIDQAGLKGQQVGGAMISNRHANFILNTGAARAADVLSLIEQIRQTVHARFGVLLELEVQVLP